MCKYPRYCSEVSVLAHNAAAARAVFPTRGAATARSGASDTLNVFPTRADIGSPADNTLHVSTGARTSHTRESDRRGTRTMTQ